MTTEPTDPILIAVDGGGSKTNVWAIDLDGRVLARRTGAGSNPQTRGLGRVVDLIDGLVLDALAEAGNRPLLGTNIYLSGLDLPVDTETFRAAIAGRSWARGVTGAEAVIDNDLIALLRAGTLEPDAVALVCGTGINCIGVRADGATARFPSLGMISGDWGGGWHLGEQALWHAVRADDGRGPGTLLTELIPGEFARGTVQEVVEGLHFKRIQMNELSRLAPAVFRAAEAGDPVGRALVERLAEEVVLMIGVAVTRLELADRDIPIVLGGGVLAAADPLLMAAITAGLADRVPRARIQLVTAPPIVGAAILALESAGRHESAERLATLLAPVAASS